MTKNMFVVFLVVAFVATLASAEERKAAFTTGEKPELAGPIVSTVPVVVTNFPVTQAVEGTVNVTGEVSISNLPPPCVEPTFAVIQVPAIPGPIQDCSGPPCRYYTSAPFTVAGWRVVSAQLVFSDGVTLFAGGPRSVAFRNFPADPVGAWFDLDNAGSGPVRGAEAIVQTSAFSTDYTGLHFSIYLSR